ncbi:MAG: TIGR00730 family Rossman fold protein [Actinomycetes bacterium]
MATVAVFCASSTSISQRYVRLAEQVGAELARRGHDLVSGGGRVSCMGAVAHAARAGGAKTVGVIPEALRRLEVADVEADELIVTADMRTRKAEMDRRADAFLVLPGGIGTLEELLEIWVSRSLSMHAKPVVVLDPDGVYDSLRSLVEQLTESGFVRPSARDVVSWVREVPAAFDALERGWAEAATMTPGIPSAEELLESEP